MLILNRRGKFMYDKCFFYILTKWIAYSLNVGTQFQSPYYSVLPVVQLKPRFFKLSIELTKNHILSTFWSFIFGLNFLANRKEKNYYAFLRSVCSKTHHYLFHAEIYWFLFLKQHKFKHNSFIFFPNIIWYTTINTNIQIIDIFLY